MTAPGAPATAAESAPPRVLWVEGPSPSLGGVALAARLGAPCAGGDDALACFAVDAGGTAALDLPSWSVERGAPLPSRSDPRYDERVLVQETGRRDGDRFVVARLATLRRLAARSRDAAAMERAFREWSRESRTWRIGRGALELRRARPAVMAVVNVTPDSFSDGGRFLDSAAAVARGEELARDGAAILDVGGESTRPGSRPVPAERELERVIPVIEALSRRVAAPISIDTTKAAVARAALAAGASIVNDTSALLDDPGLASVVAEAGAGLVLMHRRGPPLSMQDDPVYADCAAEVAAHLHERAAAALRAGVARESIVLDPGLGFGKRLEDNLDLLAAAGAIRSLGFPVLVGASRKRFLGELTGRAVDDREAATLAATAAALESGAELVRVHDAARSVDLLRVLGALRDGGGRP